MTHVQLYKVSHVNEALNDLCVDIDDEDNDEALRTKCKLATHQLLEFRRIVVSLRMYTDVSRSGLSQSSPPQKMSECERTVSSLRRS